MTISDASGNEDNMETLVTTFADFADANDSDDDAEMRAEVAALNIGDSAVFGGGAQPIFTITRLDPNHVYGTCGECAAALDNGPHAPTCSMA